MKSITICVAAILFVCYVGAADYHEQTQGDCRGGAADNTTIVVKSSMWDKTPINKFIEYRVNFPRYVRGVRHIDLKSAQVGFRIADGALGTQYVKIHLKSQPGHGINSKLFFYTNY